MSSKTRKLEKRIKRFLEGEFNSLGLNRERINNIQNAVNRMNSVQNGQFMSNIQRNLDQAEANLRSMDLDPQTKTDLQNILNRVRALITSTDQETIARVVEEFRSNRFGLQDGQWIESIRSRIQKL